MICNLYKIVIVSSNICIKTVELTKSNINQVEYEMNEWLSLYPNIKVVNLGTYRSDDDNSWYHGGYISYYCESIKN